MGLEESHNGFGEDSTLDLYKDVLANILEQDIAQFEKIKLLTTLKNTITFEIVYLENYHTYKTITKPKKKNESSINKDLETKYHSSIASLLKDVELPVFNSEPNFVESRIKLFDLLQQVEEAIFLILLNENSRTQVSTKSNRRSITKYDNSMIALLFQLLIQQNILPDNKTKTSVLLSQFTGIPGDQLRKSLSSVLTGKGSNKFNKKDIEMVYNDLKEMLETLEPHIQKG